MDGRTRPIRWLAWCLAGVWAGAGMLALAGPLRGAEAVLIGLPFVAVVVAAFAALAPPAAWRRPVLPALAGLALLLAGGFGWLLAARPAGGGPLVGPPAGLAYAAAVAIGPTALLAAAAWLGDRRRMAVAAGAAVAAGLALSVVGSGLATGCGAPRAAAGGRLESAAEAWVDGRPVGRASLVGSRDGSAEEWTGEVAGPAVEPSVRAYVATSGAAWLRDAVGDWQPAPAPPAGTLDTAVVAVLGAASSPAVEDMGVESLDGLPTRRCRAVITGKAAAEALRPVSWLVETAALSTPTGLGAWRGTLEWWVDEGGVLVAATTRVGGLPADAWPLRGAVATIRGQLRVVDRDAPQDIREPLP